MSLPSPIKYYIADGSDLDTLPIPYDYVLDGAGVIKRVSNPHFLAHTRVAHGHVAGLPLLPVGLTLRVPKIPARWLYRVLDHAAQAGNGGGVLRPIEQMYHFHYINGQWRVSLPKQQASAARVSYRGGSEATVVLDLHSHHNMSAYFSRTDDEDEQGCRFYAVIGRIYSRPEIRLRLGLYGDFIELPATELFDGLGPFMEAESDDN
jgi:PRTRC genetic system protein A